MFKPLGCCLVLVAMAMTQPAEAQERPSTPQVQAIAQEKVKVPGTDYEVVLNGVDIQSAASFGALLSAIETWLATSFDLLPAREKPVIEFVSATEITALRYRGLAGQQALKTASADKGLAPGEAEVVAVYVDATRTIYLPEGWTGHTPAELSVLVHEMVHHFQNLSGVQYECPRAREALAYTAQDRWLGLFGHSLEIDFETDPFTLLIRTSCMH